MMACYVIASSRPDTHTIFSRAHSPWVKAKYINCSFFTPLEASVYLCFIRSESIELKKYMRRIFYRRVNKKSTLLTIPFYGFDSFNTLFAERVGFCDWRPSVEQRRFLSYLLGHGKHFCHCRLIKVSLLSPWTRKGDKSRVWRIFMHAVFFVFCTRVV